MEILNQDSEKATVVMSRVEMDTLAATLWASMEEGDSRMLFKRFFPGIHFPDNQTPEDYYSEEEKEKLAKHTTPEQLGDAMWSLREYFGKLGIDMG